MRKIPRNPRRLTLWTNSRQQIHRAANSVLYRQSMKREDMTAVLYRAEAVTMAAYLTEYLNSRQQRGRRTILSSGLNRRTPIWEVISVLQRRVRRNSVMRGKRYIKSLVINFRTHRRVMLIRNLFSRLLISPNKKRELTIHGRVLLKNLYSRPRYSSAAEVWDLERWVT